MTKKSETTLSHKAQLKAVELEKERIELKRARASLEFDEMRLRQARRDAEWKEAASRRLGIFDLTGQVGGSALDLAEDIRQYCRVYEGKPVTLNIFSPGGSVFHGLDLYNALRAVSAQGHHVTTVVTSYAASMGSILFLAGDTRLIGAEGQVMFHALSAGTGGSLHDMKDDIKWYERLNKQLDGVITSRTKITPDQLEKKSHKTDWWMGSKEAIRLGVAHGLA